MTTINLLTSDQHLTVVSQPKLASGDQLSVQCQVEFDAEWNGYARSAVFFVDKSEDIYEVLLDAQNACIIPHEVLKDAGVLYIGVRGVVGATVKTSCLVKYKIVEGAPTGTGTAVDPTPDVYQQLLAKYEQAMNRMEDVTDTVEAAETLARSWAVGGTGTRSGEDTNNAKYYAEQANKTIEGQVMFSKAQTLTDSEKAQARKNIGARVDVPANDASVAYIKPVPQGASDVAEIKTLGGMTYKDGDTLRSAPVTAVESVGKNICPVANIATNEIQSGAIQIYGIKKHGKYTLSADITKYADDTATNTRITISVNYTDGTKTELGCAVDASSSESDGVARRKTVTINTDTAKTISHIVLYLLNYSVANNRNAKAENICFVYGAVAEYTPYVKNTIEIPEAVQALDGYGWGVNESCYNSIVCGNDGKCAFKKNAIKYSFTGDEYFSAQSGYYLTNTSSYLGGKKFKSGVGLCDKFDISSTDGIYPINDTQVRFYVTGTYASVDLLKAQLKVWHNAGNPLTVVFVLADPEVTDISDIMGDNHVEVVEGGTLTFVNEHGLAVPSVVDFSASADVRAVPQSFNENQKAQIRENIGLGEYRNIHVVSETPSDLSAYNIGDIILVTE